MKGLVISSLYGKYTLFSNGSKLDQLFTLKGALQKQKVRIVAGDYVEYDENDSTIISRYERKSYIKRPEIANIDYLVIVSSLKEPTFSFDLIFKYLTYANACSIKPVIVITKTDIGDEAIVNQIKEIFTKLGIKLFFISNKTLEGLNEIKEFLNGQVFCLMGQSGVGKSSFLNSIDSNFQRAIGQYSEALGRGKHQTKETILFPYNGGFIADTPGFSSLELNLDKQELAHYFPGFMERYTSCEYSDCLHISEKNCKVKEALTSGDIPSIAYDCYIKMLEEIISYRRGRK